MPRPKSAGDIPRPSNDNDALLPEPVASPTKGILLTPGTAGAKRKTVTFADAVQDNEEKRTTKSGIPDDCPGKFPSPWIKGAATEERDGDAKEKGRGRSKLTEALEQARDESVKRKRSDKGARFLEDEDTSSDTDEPKSADGKYWKAQYDSYRENSQREVKKLIAKQKMAKSFAKDKDFQCTDLADQLRQEKKKVEKLEKRTVELEAQLKQMQAQLCNRESLEQPAGAQKANNSEARSRRAERKEPAKAAATTAAEHLAPEESEKEAPTSRKHQLQSDQAPAIEEKQKSRRQARPDPIRKKTGDDIWNQSFKSSSPELNRHSDQGPLSPNAGRTVTSGTHATPLKSLSINGLPKNRLERRDSAQPSPPDMDRFAKEPLVRQEVRPSRKPEKASNSEGLSPSSPQPTPQKLKETRPSSQSPMRHKSSKQDDQTEDLSIQVPASSPFEPDPILSPPNGAAKRSYFDHKEEGAKTSGSLIAKENAPPAVKAKASQADVVKPTAAWKAINAPAAGRRIGSLTDKSGKEVGLDRIEAAKARLAARGRTVS